MSTFTVYWALVLGIVMMFVIFFLPTGVLGYMEEKFKLLRAQPVAKE